MISDVCCQISPKEQVWIHTFEAMVISWDKGVLSN